MHGAVHEFRRTISGRSFIAKVDVEACAACGEAHVPANLIRAFERAVAVDLARRGPPPAAAFQVVRGAIALESLGDPVPILPRLRALRDSFPVEGEREVALPPPP